MVCINCFHQKTSVINSRTHKSTVQVWRRRRCAQCKCTFTTYERVSVSDELMVDSLSSGKKTSFDPGKLVYDIIKCFGHSPEKAVQALWLVQTVENELLKSRELTVSTQKIATITYRALSSFDSLAGEQYAVRHRKNL